MKQINIEDLYVEESRRNAEVFSWLKHYLMVDSKLEDKDAVSRLIQKFKKDFRM